MFSNKSWSLNTRILRIAAVFFAAGQLLAGGVLDVAAAEPTKIVSSWESIEKAAEAEGNLVLYSAFSEDRLKEIVTAFRAKYPKIKINYTRLTSTPLLHRFRSEVKAGVNEVDVITVVDKSPIKDACREGILEGSLMLPEAEKNKWPANQFDGCGAVVQIALWKIYYNNKSIDAAAAPKNWESLVDPRYKGRLLLLDPGSAANVWSYQVMREAYGDDFLKKLRAQSPKWHESNTPMLHALVAGIGDVAAVISTNVALPVIAKGAPITGVTTNPTMGSELTVAISKTSKRKNAALVFMNWMMSVEGQTVIARDAISALPGIPNTETLPVNFKSLDPTLAGPNTKNGLHIRDLLGRP